MNKFNLGLNHRQNQTFKEQCCECAQLGEIVGDCLLGHFPNMTRQNILDIFGSCVTTVTFWNPARQWMGALAHFNQIF